MQEAPVSCAAGEGNDPTGRLRVVVGFEPEGASPPPPMPSCWGEGAGARLAAEAKGKQGRREGEWGSSAGLKGGKG